MRRLVVRNGVSCMPAPTPLHWIQGIPGRSNKHITTGGHMRNFSSSVVAFLLVSLVIIGCADREQSLAPELELLARRVAAQKGDGKTDPGTISLCEADGECYVVYYEPWDFSQEIATETGTQPDPSLPLWQGESVVSGGTYVCPTWWPNPDFKVIIPQHNYTLVHFSIPGQAHASFPVTPPPNHPGIPSAAYAMPLGRYRDVTNNYVAEGGYIYAACYTKWVTLLNVTAIVGPMVSFNYTGTVMFEPASGTGGSDAGGWAYSNIEIEVENGVGDGWRDALDTFLSGGGCTKGWEIWVDDDQACDANGNLV